MTKKYKKCTYIIFPHLILRKKKKSIQISNKTKKIQLKQWYEFKNKQLISFLFSFSLHPSYNMFFFVCIIPTYLLPCQSSLITPISITFIYIEKVSFHVSMLFLFSFYMIVCLLYDCRYTLYFFLLKWKKFLS